MITVRMSSEQYAELASKMSKEDGVTVNGNEAKISKMGVSAEAHYKEGVFSITVLDKPFFVTTEYCKSR